MGSNVLVVIGVGGMGQAIARRQGAGKTVLLADFNEAVLKSVAAQLTGEGHNVVTQQVDVSSGPSVAALAGAAADLGAVTDVVHTAGVSPVHASTSAVLNVDLLGVALVLEEFGRVIASGGAGVVISSMAGYFAAPLDAEQERALATTSSGDLLDLPFVDADADPGRSYSLAKRGNHFRVQAASASWGARGARINSISPGVISTPMGQAELAGDSGAGMRAMVAGSATRRVGTPDDIADAVAFLLGPTASFISGTDLLVDGGAIAGVRYDR